MGFNFDYVGCVTMVLVMVCGWRQGPCEGVLSPISLGPWLFIASRDIIVRTLGFRVHVQCPLLSEVPIFKSWDIWVHVICPVLSEILMLEPQDLGPCSLSSVISSISVGTLGFGVHVLTSAMNGSDVGTPGLGVHVLCPLSLAISVLEPWELRGVYVLCPLLSEGLMKIQT